MVAKIVQDIGLMAKVLARKIRACELKVARDSAFNRFKGAIVNLAVFAAATTLGTAMTKSPNAGLMMGMSVMHIAGGMLNAHLGLGPIANTCMSGAEGMKEQREKVVDEKQKHALDMAIEKAEKYEDEFNVSSTMKRLNALLAGNPEAKPPQPAMLEVAIAELKKAIDDIAELEGSVQKADDWMRAQNIDPDNPSTIPKASPLNSQSPADSNSP